MSGDFGVDNEPVLFYTEEMTVSKLILLKHKGIELNLYQQVMRKLGESRSR